MLRSLGFVVVVCVALIGLSPLRAVAVGSDADQTGVSVIASVYPLQLPSAPGGESSVLLLMGAALIGASRLARR